jgi:tubulin beta
LPGREILVMHVGQGGNQIGYNFWKTICREHGVDIHNLQKTEKNEEGVDYKSVFLVESPDGFHPRALFIDLEPLAIEFLVREKGLGQFFSDELMLLSYSGAHNVWSIGYSLGKKLIPNLLEKIRSIVPDTLQGFIIIHTLGGGTGSGFGSLITETLKKEFPGKGILNFSVLPSEMNDITLAPYNTVLSINHLSKFSDLTVLFDNTALMRLVKDQLNKPLIKQFSDLNFLIGRVMASITASLRFPGQLNMDLMEMAHNLVALPETKFIIPSIAPLTKEEGQISTELDLVERCFDPSHYMVNADSVGEAISSVLMFRGDMPIDSIYNIMSEIKKNIKFVSGVHPDLGLKYGLSESESAEFGKEVTLLSNNTAITDSLNRILDRFDSMFSKEWYISHYLESGLSRADLQDARDNFENIIRTYENLRDSE